MRRIARFGMLGLTIVLIVVAMQIVSVSPALAATITNLKVTCQQVTVAGKTEVNTSYVKVSVVLASNLGTVLAQQVVLTKPRAGANYFASLNIRRAHLAEGTRVVIAVGEWDGTRYLRPATIIGADCSRDSGAEPPTPAPSPTMVSTLPPTPIPSPTFISTPPPTPTRPPQ